MKKTTDFANTTKRTSVFDMQSFLGNSQANNIIEIPIASLTDYPNQPFKRYTDDKLAEMAEDIAQNGVLHPILVRVIGDDKYQILSGHNRRYASELAGLTTVPCKIIYNCNDNVAARIMVNCNLNQREQLLPSEKAYAYKIQIESYDGNIKSFADDNKVGRSSVFRYLRLTFLSPTLLDMVDRNTITLVTGESLSYLSPEQQRTLVSYCMDNSLSIEQRHADALKEMCKDKPDFILDDEILDEVFGKNKKSKSTSKAKKEVIKLDKAEVEQYIPDSIDIDDLDEVKRFIMLAVTQYAAVVLRHSESHDGTIEEEGIIDEIVL